MFNAAAELSEINNLPFHIHSSLSTPRPMRAEPTETGGEQKLRDNHAWRRRGGDPDKEEINIGRGGKGCVQRCSKKM